MIESILAVIGLILSAFFSGTEIAFVQANPIQLEVWQNQGRSTAGKTLRLLSEPERFLTTVLIGTNLANVLTSSYATVALLSHGVAEVWTILVVSSVILVFGEIIPKVFFREHANSLAAGITPFLNLAELLLAPFVKLVKAYSRLLSPGNRAASSGVLTRQDLRVLFGEVQPGQELEADEKEVITRIFDFGARPVREAMTPRPDMVCIPPDCTIDDATKVLVETGFSKLPVYQGDPDNIVGVIFLHDLFAHPKSVASVMKRPLFVSASTPANEVLEALKGRKSSIAIVIGSDGRTAGLVTVEDLVEELFGEFEDVFDAAGRTITRVPGGSLVVDSLVEIVDLKKHGFQIPVGDYETIGGFILSRLGRIPHAGELLDFGSFRVKVLLASANRLKRLHLIKES